MEENTQTPTQNKQSSPNIGVIVAVVAVIGAIAFIGLKSTKPTTTDSMTAPTTQTAMTQESTPAVEAASDVAVKTIDMDAGAFYYKPAEIRVKVGDKIKIVMTSKDMMHDFNIDELNVKIPVTRSGQTNTVEFTATKAGTFEYYCSVGEHREQGQIGKLIVE